MTTQTYRVELTRPHPGQQVVITEAKRFNVLQCGRRFGKTILGDDRAAETALAGKPAAWFAPTYKLLKEPWETLNAMLAPVIRRSSVADMEIHLITDGRIDFWSLDNTAYPGRGRKYARVVIDEAAAVRDLETVWNAAVRPTLTDLIGDAWFLSTPAGHGYFHQLYLRGQSNDPEWHDWASWRFGTVDNPYISRDEVEEARRTMPEFLFMQEYLGIPIQPSEQFFRTTIVEDHRKRHAKPPRRCRYVGADGFRDDPNGSWFVFTDAAKATNYVIGMDISSGTGKSNSVATVMDRTTGAIVAEYVDPQILDHELAEMVCKVGRTIYGGQCGQAFLIWEANGPGEGFYKHVLRQDYSFFYYQRNVGVRAELRSRKYGWHSTRENKRALLSDMHRELATGGIVIPSDQGLNEMLDYIFYDDGSVGPSLVQDDTTGAKLAHGDRVIGYMLCVHGRREAPHYTAPKPSYAPGTWGDLAGLDELNDEDESAGVIIL